MDRLRTPPRSERSSLPPAPGDGAILVVVSIDVEEDNWTPDREKVTVANVRELPRLHAFLRGFGVRPTYLTTYTVVERPWAAEVIRTLAESGDAEVGSHLHPWNTPPLREPLTPRNTMVANLHVALQREKVAVLTRRLSAVLGTRPTAFRAGRFGLGAALIRILAEHGYAVDSSVTPFVDWTDYDGGPNFIGAPVDRYRIGGGSDPRVPSPEGALVELPVSSGFSRRPFDLWSRVHRVLDSGWKRRMRVWGVVSRLGVARKVILSPESETATDMMALSRRLIEQDVRCLHLFLHSSSLRAGLSPFAKRESDVLRVYKTLGHYLESLQRTVPVRFVTASEAAGVSVVASEEARTDRSADREAPARIPVNA